MSTKTSPTFGVFCHHYPHQPGAKGGEMGKATPKSGVYPADLEANEVFVTN
jgi:hypothetical protein